MPYMRIFEDVAGAWEEEITRDRIRIGRSYEQADLVLRHRTVSRLHAILERGKDCYIITDAGSRSGVLVNGNETERSALKHGDSIQIGVYVLEYRADDEAHQEETRAIHGDLIDNVLRDAYRLLPTGIRLRYRTLSWEPEEVFETGDTLKLGDGGLLLPCEKTLEEGTCLEVEITDPRKRKRNVLGEVKAILTYKEPPAMCIKLHAAKKFDLQSILSHGRRGSWVHGWPPQDTELDQTMPMIRR